MQKKEDNNKINFKLNNTNYWFDYEEYQLQEEFYKKLRGLPNKHAELLINYNLKQKKL
jgi:hypothetical protein